jgi:hypothetical protein
MAKSQNLQTSFASGELSPLLLGRTDLEQYYKGVQTADNVVIVPQGGVKRRPGTEFIDSTIRKLTRQTAINPTMPNGGTASNLNDGDDDTYGFTDSAATVGGSSGFVIAQYDAGAGQTFDNSFLDIRNIRMNYRGTPPTPTTKKTTNIFVEHSSDGSSWQSIQDSAGQDISLSIDNLNFVNFRFDIKKITDTTYYRYWRIRTDLDGTDANVQDYGIRVGEFGFKSESINASISKMFEWEYAADQSYLAVLTENNLRFYRAPHNGSTSTVYVADVVVPYSEADLVDVRSAQTEGVMLMFHEDHPPIRIIFNGSDEVDAFVVDNIPFTNVPQYDYDDADSPTPSQETQTVTFSHFAAGNTYQIDVEGILSKTITFAGDANSDQQDSTAENLRKNLQDMPNFPNSGISVQRTASNAYTISFADASAGPLELLSGFATGEGVNTNSSAALSFARVSTGSSRSEDIWSDTRGYPSIGVFYDGRLWLGGTKSKKQSLFASRPGDFFNYDIGSGDDDNAIFITIDGRGLTNIVDINPDRGLQVFCSGSEFIVKGNTPATIIVEQQTRHGSFPLQSQSIDGSTLFVDKNGKTLRQFLFNFNEDAFTSTDISVLSSQLIDQPVDMAILPGTTTDDANWVFIVNQDGGGAVLNTMRSQDINGFTRWTPGASSDDATKKNEVQSCAVVGDQMYMVVKRVVGTAVQVAYYDIERWDFDRKLESGVKATYTKTGSDIAIEVGARLEGYEVGVVADGDVLPNRTVTNNEVTITAAEMDAFTSREIEVGLNFTVTVKPMPLNTNVYQGGQNTMKRKKIVRMDLRVYESAGIEIDGNFVPVRSFGDASASPLGTPLTIKSGIIEDDNGGNGWDLEVVPEIKVAGGTPFHLQAISYEVSSS